MRTVIAFAVAIEKYLVEAAEEVKMAWKIVVGEEDAASVRLLVETMMLDLPAEVQKMAQGMEEGMGGTQEHQQEGRSALASTWDKTADSNFENFPDASNLNGVQTIRNRVKNST